MSPSLSGSMAVQGCVTKLLTWDRRTLAVSCRSTRRCIWLLRSILMRGRLRRNWTTRERMER
jgi:hypothetical protein